MRVYETVFVDYVDNINDFKIRMYVQLLEKILKITV